MLLQKKRTPSVKSGTYCKCMHCGDEIPSNTHKQFTFCACKKIAVDGCEYYVRISGDKKDYHLIQK